MSLDTSQKTCTKCGKSFPATPDFFRRAKYGAFGLRGDCKECSRAESKSDSGREQRRKWRLENPEKSKESSRNWRKRNENHSRQYARDWIAKNPEKSRARSHRRRARMANAPGKHTETDIRFQKEKQSDRCYWCGCDLGKSYHVDHVVPLVRGGGNDPANIVISCPTCNLRKGSKLPSEWH